MVNLCAYIVASLMVTKTARNLNRLYQVTSGARRGAARGGVSRGAAANVAAAQVAATQVLVRVAFTFAPSGCNCDPQFLVDFFVDFVYHTFHFGGQCLELVIAETVMLLFIRFRARDFYDAGL